MGQTRHKLVRTFTNQDRLLREHGGWVFNQSSPQAYAWVEEDAPDLFEAIVGLIRAGRWEADGATWVEPDTLLPGGESLVRQLLYGKRYFAERLGVESRMFWAPDAFGFSPALPQLLRQAGVDGMVTSKLSWNRYNRFPHDTFRWRGMDGTETVCHFITAPNVIYGRFGLEPYMTTYVGLMKVEEIKQTWERYRQKHAGTEPLMTFGFGDGGGGPTEEMLQTAARLSARSTSEGIPRIRFEKAGELLQRLVKRAPDLPVWDGELDLELHRGTYTTQGWLKRANRKNEVLLHQLEWLSAIASRYGHEPDKPLLDETWKDLLLCQFHDILPGTSISEVYEEEVRPLQRSIAGRAGALLDRACETLCRGIDTRGFESPLVLFNTLSWDRSEPFRLPDGSWRDDVTVPAGGWTVIEGAVGAAEPRRSAAVEPELSVEGGGRRIVSHFWVLELDEEGRIAHLYDRRRDREVVPPGARANEWQVFEDRPMHFDAWDIDAYYEEHRLPGPRCVSAEVVERGPVRVAVELVWEMPDVSAGPPSRISQRIALYASSPRIDFETTVDWHETHQLLKAAFPVDVRATEAAYEVQFGHVRRPTHRNTPWDAARFEGWAHRFVDLSEHGYGVALLNDCKYGHDVRDGVIRLTCLRSPTDPDPTADRGAHEFTYALLPHGGAFQDAGIVRAAAELNVPLVIRAPRAEAGGLPSHSSPVRCEEPAVVIETLKAAEDGDGVVLRCYESHGSHARATLRFSDAPGSVEAVDLLEAPVGNDALLAHEGGEVRLRLRPFQVFSLRLRGW
jgi:alpha-mannosidase